MAQTEVASSSNSRQVNPNRNSLHIDNVVSTQPELGPTPPDGGYGWVILICAVLTQITVPSMIYAYGVILLFLNLSEGYEENEVFKIYERYIILVPILMTVFGLLYTEWGRTLVLITNRPRIVGISGVFLMAAGLLLSNFGADSPENDIMVTISSGLIAGVGSSLMSQQSEILLRHYFRNKLSLVLTIYKSSAILGNIIIPLITCALLTSYGASMTIIILSAIVVQQAIAMLFLTRPTYIVQALDKNYKVLKEDEEDEDETIYSHVRQHDENDVRNGSETNNNVNKIKVDYTVDLNQQDDQDDEQVIATFNRGNKTNNANNDSPPTPNVVSYDRGNGTRPNDNPFESNFRVNFDQIESHEDPQTLYRETTVANDINNDHIFSFDPPTTGTLRRTANTKKNLTVFVSILKDLRFYAYTLITLCHNFSSLLFGAFFPAYLSQQLPTMDMTSVIGMVLVVQIGAMCLTLITAYFSLFKHKAVIRFSSWIATAGFIGLSGSSSRSAITVWGIMAIFGTNSIQIAVRPIYNRTSMEFEPTAISQISTVLAGIIIFVIMIVHNHTYALCFKITAMLNVVIPFFMFKY